MEFGWLFIFVMAALVYVAMLHDRIAQWKKRARFVQDTEAYRSQIEAALKTREATLRDGEREVSKQRAKLKGDQEHHERILDETVRVYPWAAKIYGDILDVEANGLARHLEYKRNPAPKTADDVRAFRDRIKEHLQRAKYGEYKAIVYESAFPFLVDLVEGAPIADLAVTSEPQSEEHDPARAFLSPGEYERLTAAERSQRALDRYIERRKSSWEIGRDYERYIGQRYEVEGWEVQYFGATQRLEDLGRDLIARRDEETWIVQCKYWSQWSRVRENAVFQLFGSVVDYLFEQELIRADEDVFASLKRNGVRGCFVTSTEMSERALAAAKALGIKVSAGIPFDPKYPRIKCNIGRGEKLYHLPFDQQYDRIKIESRKGERYVATVAEAERLGFRRVYRWRGPAGA